MIFIPFFKKIDWSHPPLITLLLVFLNCLIFLTFQSKDGERLEQAFEFYLESRLPEMEIPLYIKFLDNKNDWELAAQYRDYLENQDNELLFDSEEQRYQLMILAAPMRMDADFNRTLKNGELFTDQSDRQTWQALNTEYEAKLHQVTTFEYGLKPNNPTTITMFSSMFLHGGFAHLLGNMVFLFIIGFVVETALGKSAYTLGYLLAGLCGNVLYIISSGDSEIPTVGASGAIAGLMGMYTVLFGLRKINFFYFVFVYFDYTKAPAIILLPIWLGHEILQLLISSNDGVNYYAHIGGLSSGALFAYIMKHHLKAVDIDYLDQNEKEHQRNDQYETALDYLAKMQVEKALQVLRDLVAEHPANRDYLLQWYKAAKLRPASDYFHTAAKAIMLLNDKHPQTNALIHSTYQEYMALAKPKPKINATLCLHLVLTFARGKFFDDAEKLLVLLKNHKQQNAVAEAILVLANAFQKANQPNKCLNYLNLIVQSHPNSSSATEASQRLRSLQEKTG